VPAAAVIFSFVAAPCFELVFAPFVTEEELLPLFKALIEVSRPSCFVGDFDMATEGIA
jgi:hypothetical protein